MDAAIAANAVLGVVEPNNNGIGGDLFAIVYEAKTGKLHGLNASGWSPTGLTAAFLEAKGHKTMPQYGIYSATVPGAVAGWDALRRKFGALDFSSSLAAAIYYAENGFPVTEIIASDWGAAAVVKFLGEHPNSKATYLPGGQAVMRDAKGVNYAGSDPRKDGAAVPEGPALEAIRQVRRTNE